MPYMTIYKLPDGKWHQHDQGWKTSCGQEITKEAEDRIIGSGHSKVQPDPPRDQVCPVCWKSLFNRPEPKEEQMRYYTGLEGSGRSFSGFMKQVDKAMEEKGFVKTGEAKFPEAMGKPLTLKDAENLSVLELAMLAYDTCPESHGKTMPLLLMDSVPAKLDKDELCLITGPRSPGWPSLFTMNEPTRHRLPVIHCTLEHKSPTVEQVIRMFTPPPRVPAPDELPAHPLDIVWDKDPFMHDRPRGMRQEQMMIDDANWSAVNRKKIEEPLEEMRQVALEKNIPMYLASQQPQVPQVIDLTIGLWNPKQEEEKPPRFFSLKRRGEPMCKAIHKQHA